MNAKYSLAAVILILIVGAGALGMLSPKDKDDGIPLLAADAPSPQVGPKKSTAKEPTRPPLHELVRMCAPAVAIVKGKVGHGTGFLLPNNVLATNAHVVSLEFEENIRVHFPSARVEDQGPYRAKFIWADRKRDLAFLEVICDIEPLELAEDYTLRPGQEIIAIGSPGLGKDELLQNAPTRGLMSNMTKLDGQPFYALSISVNPGNSGGPVIDMDGHVLGMVTAKMRDKEGIAFAIPLEDLRNGYDHEVVAQGREAGPEMTAWIRACTVFERLIFLGEEYSYGLDTYSNAMETAFSRGHSPNDGLRAVSKDVEQLIKQTSKVFADDLEKNVNLIVRDEHLRESDRVRISELWKCCRDMKAMIDQPNGTLDSYRAKKEHLKVLYRDLTSIHEKPKKPVKKRDPIQDH